MGDLACRSALPDGIWALLRREFLEWGEVKMITIRPNVFLTGAAFLAFGSLSNPALAADSQIGAATTAPGAARQSTATSGAVLEEVVVTAEKRETSLLKTPISASVLGGKQLDQSTNTGLTQILNSVPGVSTTVDFQSGGTQMAVRGVSAAGPIFVGSGTVAYYLDGMPFGFVRSAGGPDLNPYDLSRVEVLRGPQGTLYGAGGLNGVVRVLTNDADLSQFDLKARMDLSNTSHGGNNYGADGAINVPLIDDVLAMRVVVGDHHYSGWIDSLNNSDVNDAHVQTYRVKVAAKPADNLTAQFTFWRNSNSYGAPSDGNSDYFNNAYLPDPVKNWYNDYGLKLAYDGPGFTVTNEASYLKYESQALTDLNPVGLQGFQGQTDLSSRVYTEELDIASNGSGPLVWSGGFFYRDARDVIYQPFHTPAATLLFGNFADASRSWAVYGELGYKFTDTLQLTGGLRYFHDASQSQALSPSALGPVSLQPYRATFNAITPRVVLQYHPDSTRSFYASYSQGFRSGVVQSEEVTVVAPNVPPAKPDRLHNYEVGAKGNLGDIVDYTAAVFFIDWRRVQQVVQTPVGNGTFVGAVVNGASASGLGAEGSLFAHLGSSLRIGATASYSDLTLDEAVYSSGILLFDKGQRLNYSPKYTLGGTAEYTFALGGSGATATWGASVNHITKQSTTTLRGPARVVTDGDDMSTVNTKLSFNSPDNRWAVSVYANNLADNNSAPIKSASTRFFDVRVQPRTVGVQLEFHL
jgi:outer membrane receptor protein involved in Fe transport